MKRIIRLTLVMLIALSLSACGGNGGGQTPSGEGDGPSGAITVWYHDYPFEESLKQVIVNFNEQYPNIRVDYEIRADGDYYSLLQTAIQSGDGPDLFWTNFLSLYLWNRAEWQNRLGIWCRYCGYHVYCDDGGDSDPEQSPVPVRVR